MEELKTAIGAMKQAEEALAKQGFVLRWKVRVKANQGFFRDMVNRLIADTAIPAVKTGTKAVRFPKELKTPQALPEQITTAADASENTEPKEDELQPITAFNTKDAASYLGITVAGIYDLVKRGRIPAHGKIGKRWFKAEELDQYHAGKKGRDQQETV